jgi:hypothetical protein
VVLLTLKADEQSHLETGPTLKDIIQPRRPQVPTLKGISAPQVEIILMLKDSSVKPWQVPLELMLKVIIL